MARFDNKIVLVTGAANGIGRCMVKCFLAEGAEKLVAVDIEHDVRGCVRRRGSRSYHTVRYHRLRCRAPHGRRGRRTLRSHRHPHEQRGHQHQGRAEVRYAHLPERCLGSCDRHQRERVVLRGAGRCPGHGGEEDEGRYREHVLEHLPFHTEVPWRVSRIQGGHRRSPSSSPKSLPSTAYASTRSDPARRKPA